MTSVATTPQRNHIAEAVERRLRQQRTEARGALYVDFDEDHARRQQFRYLIDKGIIERNPPDVAIKSLQTVKTIAENVVKFPDVQKYAQLRHEAPRIKRDIVQPKGALELILEVSWIPRKGKYSDIDGSLRTSTVVHPPNYQPQDMQAVYAFQKQYMSDLRIGLCMINEALERELPKKEREERALEEAKAAEEEAREKARKRIADDRKSVQRRVAREVAQRRASIPSPQSSVEKSPGPAIIHTLSNLNLGSDSAAIQDAD
ncbi:hypothetical protein WOLCODRAFT_16827 [Wolfiporia cocos MD-104 SS10]|uniref:Uncharacterized protein n=1 Tax=Wolfiporia cocos (strain MD-104) TaxID=742152 RepID=A0A2H3JMA7_WOLCO|nr:hypothetical protein WOLCODRAFT_16827 [Wolfiporia cocos MD-104 SS10]